MHYSHPFGPITASFCPHWTSRSLSVQPQLHFKHCRHIKSGLKCCDGENGLVFVKADIAALAALFKWIMIHMGWSPGQDNAHRALPEINGWSKVDSSNIKTTTISDLPLIPKDMQNPITADWSWVCEVNEACAVLNTLSLTWLRFEKWQLWFWLREIINRCKNKTTIHLWTTDSTCVCWWILSLKCARCSVKTETCSQCCLCFNDVSEVPGFSNTHRSIPPRLLVRTQTESLAVKVNQLNRCLLLLSVCNRFLNVCC